jgi:hypothetical protein
MVSAVGDGVFHPGTSLSEGRRYRLGRALLPLHSTSPGWLCHMYPFVHPFSLLYLCVTSPASSKDILGWREDGALQLTSLLLSCSPLPSLNGLGP